jgi:hypothetical protein
VKKKGRGVRSVAVTYDDDGGCTVRDTRSGLLVSIIGTHPDASGPIGIHVEVYDYNGREVLMQDASIPKDKDGNDMPLRLTIAKHPHVAFYPDNKSVPSDIANLGHVAHDEGDARTKW